MPQQLGLSSHLPRFCNSTHLYSNDCQVLVLSSSKPIIVLTHAPPLTFNQNNIS